MAMISCVGFSIESDPFDHQTFDLSAINYLGLGLWGKFMYRFGFVFVALTMFHSLYAVDFIEGADKSGDVYLYSGNTLFDTAKTNWPEMWYAMVNDNNKWSLKKSQISISEIWEKSIKLKTDEKKAIFFLRGEEFSSGDILGTGFGSDGRYKENILNLNIEHADAPYAISCNSDSASYSVQIYLGENRYSLSCQKINMQSYAVYLKMGAVRQKLVEGQYSEWMILWMGDLDKDGFIDFIDSFTTEESVCNNIWLSTKSNKGLVSKAAHVRGDC